MTAQRELPIVDNYASAWRDDGTESGVSRVEITRDRYVCMPFKRGFVALTTVGSVVNQINGGSPGKNSDGSGTYLTVTVNSSATLANTAIAGFWIGGNVFGLRYTATSNPIGCMIDGVAYPVPATASTNPRTGYSNGGTPSTVDEVIIATDLGQGRHYVELVFPASKTTTYSYEILGYIVDSQAGYTPPSGFVDLRATTLNITGTTGGTSQVIPSSLAIFNGTWGFRKLLFANITAIPATVYMVYSTATSTIIWQKIIPANDGYDLDFCGIMPDISNVKVYVSVSGAINVTPIAVGG